MAKRSNKSTNNRPKPMTKSAGLTGRRFGCGGKIKKGGKCK